MNRRFFLGSSAAAIAAGALPLPVLAEALPPVAPDLPIGFAMPFTNAAGVTGHTLYAGGQRFVEAAGQYVSKAEYPELYELLSTMYGFKIGDDDVFGMPTLSLDKLTPALWGERTIGGVWNEDMLPILAKEPGPTYQPGEVEAMPYVTMPPLRDKTVDDGLGPDGAAAGKFTPILDDYWPYGPPMGCSV